MRRPRLFTRRRLTRRQKLYTLMPSALILAVVVIGYLLLRPAPAPPPVIRRADAYGIAAPEQVAAGERFVVQVDGIESSQSEVLLDVVTPYGARRITAVPLDGRATIEVPNDLTEQSGTMRLVAHTAIGEATASLVVTPGTAVDRITPLAGPRSVVADTEDWTMVVLLPRDRFGNIVAEGTPTTLRARRPNGDNETIDAEVRNMLTWMRVYSGTLAGRTTVRADVGDATGAEVEVLEVAGPPVPFELLGPALDGRADGRTLVTIETEQLVDQYDNVLPDGTSVVFRTTGPAGTATEVTSTIGGRATIRIESPTVQGVVTVQAHVGEVLSEALEVPFNGDVGRFDLSAMYNPAGTRVDVGPVLSVLGGFVPDGTKVVIRSSLDEITATIDDGRVTVTIAAAAGDTIEAELLGTTAMTVLR
jgi:hypothetical protein